MRSHSVVAPPRSVATPMVDRPQVSARCPGVGSARSVLAIVVGMQIGPIAIPLGQHGRRHPVGRLARPVRPVRRAGSCGLGAAGLVAHRDSWVLLAVAGVVFTQGHGLHLAANSVGNVAPGRTEHLWDEVVGHYIWYTGLALLVFAVARELAPRPLPSGKAWWFGILGAAALGVTIFDNLDEGGVVPAGSLMVAAFIAYGWRFRRTSGLLLVIAYGVTALALAGWGVYWGGWPQFSQLGWI